MKRQRLRNVKGAGGVKMQPCGDGEWVLFEDAQKELDERMKQLAKLEKELDAAHDVIVKLSACLLEHREKHENL